MYDIPELEKKWRKYKRNRIKKPLLYGAAALIVIVGLSIVAASYLGKNESGTVASNVPIKKSTQAKAEEKRAIVITKTPVAPQKSQTNQNPLIAVTASNNSMPQAPEESIDLSKATIVQPNLPKDDIRVIDLSQKGGKTDNRVAPKAVIPQKSSQEIEEQEKIAEVEERFRATQDPKDSLIVAKYYYKKHNYKKAESWAVNTNNIDGDIEESWLIFAKSRAKQGFRVDAIKVLQSYYDETKSPKAKELLDKLRFGKEIN